MNNRTISFSILVAIITLTAFASFSFAGEVRGAVAEEISKREQEIAEIQRKIAEYQKEIDTASSEAKSLSSEVRRLNASISKIQAEIQGLSLEISQTDGEIYNTQQQIDLVGDRLEIHRQALGQYLIAIDRYDKVNFTEMFFKNDRLSDFFNEVQSLEDTHENLHDTIVSVKRLKMDLEERELNLAGKKSELAQMKAIQEAQKLDLAVNKNSKNNLLVKTKNQEAKYQELVKLSNQEITNIREQISFLIQSGLTVEDAIKFAQLAAIRVGIRPGLLIGLAEVETRLGKNVGTGNWRDDMYQCYLDLAKKYPSKSAYYTKRANDEKNAFFEIINGLGLDPDSVKVSARPSYGCGGAMGIAQFIATTWRGYAERVANFTGHNPPNPWSYEDAFMASAIKLANDGAVAKTRSAEIRAAKAYISGNPNCNSSICNYYANLVLDKAEVIERNLLSQ